MKFSLFWISQSPIVAVNWRYVAESNATIIQLFWINTCNANNTSLQTLLLWGIGWNSVVLLFVAASLLSVQPILVCLGFWERLSVVWRQSTTNTISMWSQGNEVQNTKALTTYHRWCGQSRQKVKNHTWSQRDSLNEFQTGSSERMSAVTK